MYIFLCSVNSGKIYLWPRLIELHGTHIYLDDKKPIKYNRICSDSMDKTLRMYILTMVVVMLSFGGVVIGPFNAYRQDGK